MPMRRKRTFETLRRTAPIRPDFRSGCGQWIDRYYIERFLSAHAEEIGGRGLEFQDDGYTRKFGGRRVSQSDVLHHAEGNPHATIVGDLTCASHIPSETFDCIICTQVLMYIYDLRAAVHTLHRILKTRGFCS